MLRVWFFILSVSGCYSAVVQATSVAFLNPGKSTEIYWHTYSQFMQAAADDLGMSLDIRYSERNPELLLEQARELLQGSQRPDYLIFVNERSAGPEILRLSKDSGVKLFAVGSTLTADQQDLIGESRGKYSNWIGSLVPDDEQAGYIMASRLIEQEKARSAGRALTMLAFSGVKHTPAAYFREEGLHRALAEHPDVTLLQLVNSEWNRQRAYEQAQLLLARYPDVSMVWAANDEMAFGAMQAAQEKGKTPGKDLLFSGLNSSEAVLQALLDGHISVLVGGHFTSGGWALVMLHDYAAGYDFAERGGKDRQDPLFMEMNKDQAAALLKRMQGSKGYSMDFGAFSAAKNPKMTDYHFSLQPLLD